MDTVVIVITVRGVIVAGALIGIIGGFFQAVGSDGPSGCLGIISAIVGLAILVGLALFK